jgi:cytochrome c-type biogenesis protein CcmH/NrfG
MAGAVGEVRGESMATLASVYSRFFDRSFEEAAEAPRAKQNATRVRAFANEDVYFFVKEISNAGVVRAADPKAGGTCWRMIGSVVAAVVLLVGVLLPGAYSLLAGYQIQALQQEAQRLATERASLELQEAHLISPERMEQLAKELQFVDPPAQKVVYLDTARNGSLAMNK